MLIIITGTTASARRISARSGLGMSCGLQVEDDNSLGTHEFIALCRMLGAEPYLAGNMGSGSVQEMCDWMEYCNSSRADGAGARARGNGANQPFGVKLWGVGNENWGCGGSYDVDSYAGEYRRYATMLRHVDPTAELVACGMRTTGTTPSSTSTASHLNAARSLLDPRLLDSRRHGERFQRRAVLHAAGGS